MARALGSKGEREEQRSAKRRGGSAGEWLYRVDVIDLLEGLDLDNISHATKDEVVCSCPFPGHTHGDRKPSLYINDGSKERSKATVWKCFGCGRSGNAISLVAELDNSTKQKAAQHLRERYASDWREPRGGSITAEVNEWIKERVEVERERRTVAEQQLIQWEHYDQLFGLEWPLGAGAQDFADDPMGYMYSRGFSSATLNAWKIGYDERSDRICIPVTNEAGDLVGVKGRAWVAGVKPKYRILGDPPRRKARRYKFRPYEKSLVVFGLDKVIGAGSACAVLCEGELDVIALWQLGIPAICTGSAALSESQARLVRDHLDEIVVFFDSDNAGDNAIWGYYNDDGEYKPGLVIKLDPFLRVRIVRRHHFDPSKMIELGLANSLLKMINSAGSVRRHWKYATLPTGVSL